MPQNPMHRGYDSHLVFLHDSSDFYDMSMRLESIEAATFRRRA